MGKETKTNAMRILERAKVPYTAHEYAHEEGVAVDGVTVAASMGEDPACVYKTLVTQGASRNYFVSGAAAARWASKSSTPPCLMRACWPSRKFMFPAGGSVPRCAAPRPTSSRQPAPQRHTSFSKDLTIIYRSNKSYLKRKRMAKLHKTFESFLAAGEHKGEIAETLFAKLFFCRKLYV